MHFIGNRDSFLDTARKWSLLIQSPTQSPEQEHIINMIPIPYRLLFAVEAVVTVPAVRNKRNSYIAEQTRWLSGKTSPLCFHHTCTQIVSIPLCWLWCFHCRPLRSPSAGSSQPRRQRELPFSFVITKERSRKGERLLCHIVIYLFSTLFT